jgi:hypothetical protein
LTEYLVEITIMAEVETPTIPKTCKAGCVVDNGPNFRVEVVDVPVPEPGNAESTPSWDIPSIHD